MEKSKSDIPNGPKLSRSTATWGKLVAREILRLLPYDYTLCTYMLKVLWQHMYTILFPGPLKIRSPPLRSTATKKQILIYKTALNIPHILDQILRYCEKPVLLQCRFLSSSWNEVSTFYLRKTVTILFINNMLDSKKRKPLEELVLIFENLQQFDTPRKAFICTNFAFTCPMLTCGDAISNDNIRDGNNKLISNISLRNFLSTHGAHIQKLALYFDDLGDAQIPTEKVIMDEIEQLLTVDLPNLNELSLSIGSEEPNAYINEAFPFSLARTKIDKIHSKYSILNSGRNWNLKCVSFAGKISAEVVEMVQVLAPNLNETRVKSAYVQFLLFNTHVYSMFDKIAQQCSKLVPKISELIFCLEPRGSGSYKFTQQMRSRIIGIMSTILKSSWDSLEEIQWIGVVTTAGLKWPPLMPKVKTFRFSKRYTTIEKNIFPPEFSWRKAFPRLCEVIIDNRVRHGIPQDLFLALNLEPIETVMCASVGWNLRQVNKMDLECLLQTHFPKARINIVSKKWFLPD